MLSARERADRVGAAMMQADAASREIGLELEEIDAGRAVMGLTLEPRHMNGHGICHGGIIFALADSCFAFACNSRNQATVAQHCMVSYLAPGRVGDRLTAHATEVSQAGRSGIYDVTVTNQKGEVIAEFRGFSRTIKGRLFDEPQPPQQGDTPEGEHT